MSELFGDETIEILVFKVMKPIEPDDLVNEVVVAGLIDDYLPGLRFLAIGDRGQWWSDLVSEITNRIKLQLITDDVAYRTH